MCVCVEYTHVLVQVLYVNNIIMVCILVVQLQHAGHMFSAPLTKNSGSSLGKSIRLECSIDPGSNPS